MGLFVQILSIALSFNNSRFIIWFEVLKTILASPGTLRRKIDLLSKHLIEPSRLSTFCDDKLTNVALCIVNKSHGSNRTRLLESQRGA